MEIDIKLAKKILVSLDILAPLGSEQRQEVMPLIKELEAKITPADVDALFRLSRVGDEVRIIDRRSGEPVAVATLPGDFDWPTIAELRG